MLKRRQLTELLVRSDQALLNQVVDHLEKTCQFEIMSPPVEGLAMIKLREHAQNSLFYVGEVQVTECRVRLGDVIGTGLIQGPYPYRAIQLAKVDAAYRAGVPELWELQPLLDDYQWQLKQADWSAWQTTLETKVDFSTMEVEND